MMISPTMDLAELADEVRDRTRVEMSLAEASALRDILLDDGWGECYTSDVYESIWGSLIRESKVFARIYGPFYTK